MAVNIFTDQMQHAELFSKPVLTTNWPIPRETVPDGWFCYDMEGTDHDPASHSELVGRAVFHHSGTVLSPEPLMRDPTATRRIGTKDYFLHGEEMDLEDFCEKYGLDFPENPIKFEMRPAPPMRRGFFMPCRPRRTNGWGQSATSASTSGTRGRSSGTLGGPGAPRN